ncbi:TonB-linked outer membrane protein, SusC/RagA family [Zhouia amylolytica]|uniref:TonB-linked outer membrane protein, SusC/RagA family n=1 Tax=Zhouia amylolytica TaxID=376730 RepID=A0A1I6S5H8_9FLAO|nr:TonB-dependent receptor [Zhouia amylolytica]MCQ0111010.1 TonB-dependent receptor [Zhouia amylolytica]SFS72192.1 TonB-linked outer membrane protein, SusC/RagA family [Zhouia amylolytica]
MKSKFNEFLMRYGENILMNMMRTFIFLCCLTTFAFGSKAGFSQNSKITIKNDSKLTVEEVFDLIKDQTDHTFIYRSDLFKDAPKVEVKRGTIKAETLLKKSLSYGNFKYSFTSDGTILLDKKPEVPTVIPQLIITGTVSDNTGAPLPGATISIKGNESVGTQTDFDGKYTIEVPDNNTILVYRFLGFRTKEVAVNSSTTVDVSLEEDAQSLDEIVVVGYGTQKKSDVTGAISTVKSEDLTQVVTTSPTDALQGRVSGVTVTSSGSPGSTADVTIRGIGSFGNNQPLYIVDGVQADPYYIDPNNIASMEVLKDAASGAIYGTKAANGVIIITTKKGKSGKPRIEINSSLSINTPAEEMNLLDADGYVNVHRQMYENAGLTLPQYVSNPPSVNTDWIEATHRTGELQMVNARVSGASENINYSIGGNYADEIGVLIGSEFTKKGLVANMGITKGKFKVNTNLNYSETYRENYKFSLRETYQISPLIPIFDDSKQSGYGYRDGDIPDHRNPIAEDHYLNSYTKSKYFLGTLSLNYEILKGLNAKANLSVSNLNSYGYNFNQPFRARDVQEEGREYAFISELNTESRRINQEYTLNYDFQAGEHAIGLLAGYQRIREPFRTTYAQAEGYKIEEDEDGNEVKVPAIILDPSFNTLDAFSDGTYTASGTNAEYSLVSQFGRVNYSFKDRYLLQASIRRDGSSKFGKNNQYGNFPSFALGWKLTEESFMENQNIFDFLKLRYSWGQAGNDSALGYYDYVALISQGKSQNDGGYVFGDPQTSYLGSIARELQNDDLQWETNTSSNIGVDFASLGRKLQGAINYYKSTTEDLLITKVVSPSSGINDPVVNVGEFENSGLEFELGYSNKDHEFKYSAFATFTTINSEVTQLSSEDQVLYGVGLKFGSDHFVNQTKVGYEPGAFFLPVADGIFQNQAEIDAHNLNGSPIQPDAQPGDIRFKDANGDGVIDDGDAVYQGTAIPKFEYSLNLTANFKNFDFNVFFQGVGGNKIYNGNSFEMLGMDSGRNFRSETLHAWTPSNTNTSIPRAVLGDPNGNNRASTRFLHDGDYLRIKTIQLGYSIPSEILDTLMIDKFRLYVTGQNLFTLSDYDGLDPEVGGDILSRGIDRSLYPRSKSFILGVQLQF